MKKLYQFLKYEYRSYLKYRSQSLYFSKKSCSIADTVIVKGPYKNFSFQQGLIIQDYSFIHLGGFDWCQNKGRLTLGKNCILSPHCVIYAVGPYGIEIGDDFGAGPGVKIFSSIQDHYKSLNDILFKPVVIGDNVQLGSNVVINAGVTIGNNVFVGAGSIVLNDIPDNCFAAGIPASIINSFKNDRK